MPHRRSAGGGCCPLRQVKPPGVGGQVLGQLSRQACCWHALCVSPSAGAACSVSIQACCWYAVCVSPNQRLPARTFAKRAAAAAVHLGHQSDTHHASSAAVWLLVLLMLREVPADKNRAVPAGSGSTTLAAQRTCWTHALCSDNPPGQAAFQAGSSAVVVTQC